MGQYNFPYTIELFHTWIKQKEDGKSTNLNIFSDKCGNRANTSSIVQIQFVLTKLNIYDPRKERKNIK